MELFLDEGKIVIQMRDLEFSGSGLILDPDSDSQERVEFRGPFSKADFILVPEEYLDPYSKNSFPRMDIQDVKLEIVEPEVIVSLFGNLPMYKSHEFESKIKRKLVSILVGNNDLVIDTLKHLEKYFFDQIPFKQNLFGPVYIQNSLSDNIKVSDDYIEIGLISELYGLDQNEFKVPLRKIRPTFSEEQKFKKDV